MTKLLIQELTKEYGELNERKEKLNAFIEENKQFEKLDAKVRYIMSKQIGFMIGYAECLKALLDIYKEKERC